MWFPKANARFVIFDVLKFLHFSIGAQGRGGAVLSSMSLYRGQKCENMSYFDPRRHVFLPKFTCFLPKIRHFYVWRPKKGQKHVVFKKNFKNMSYLREIVPPTCAPMVHNYESIPQNQIWELPHHSVGWCCSWRGTPGWYDVLPHHPSQLWCQ